MTREKTIKSNKLNGVAKEHFEYLDNDFYENIKNAIEQSKHKIYSSLRSESLHAFWLIGNMILEKQKGEPRAEYGDGLIKELSIQMTKDFGPGFNDRNLRFMRQFATQFPNWNAVRTELSWTHYRSLLKV